MSKISALKSACSGRWQMILPQFHIDAAILDGKHHPCPSPACPAQKDGFRMTDIAEGEWICSGKGAEHHGDGFDLIEEVCGLPIGESLRQVAGIVKVAWSGGADVYQYGSRRERLMQAIIDDVVSKKEADDGFAPR